MVVISVPFSVVVVGPTEKVSTSVGFFEEEQIGIDV
jgi:hypothetical protein